MAFLSEKPSSSGVKVSLQYLNLEILICLVPCPCSPLELSLSVFLLGKKDAFLEAVLTYNSVFYKYMYKYV